MLGWMEGKPYHVVARFDESADMGYIINCLRAKFR